MPISTEKQNTEYQKVHCIVLSNGKYCVLLWNIILRRGHDFKSLKATLLMLWRIIWKMGYEISLDMTFLLYHNGLQMLFGLLLMGNIHLLIEFTQQVNAECPVYARHCFICWGWDLYGNLLTKQIIFIFRENTGSVCLRVTVDNRKLLHDKENAV